MKSTIFFQIIIVFICCKLFQKNYALKQEEKIISCKERWFKVLNGYEHNNYLESWLLYIKKEDERSGSLCTLSKS